MLILGPKRARIHASTTNRSWPWMYLYRLDLTVAAIRTYPHIIIPVGGEQPKPAIATCQEERPACPSNCSFFAAWNVIMESLRAELPETRPSMESPMPKVIDSVITVLRGHREALHKIRALEEEVARLDSELSKLTSSKEDSSWLQRWIV